MSTLLAGLVISVALSACGAGTPFSRASQGDIALCVYVRGLQASEVVALKVRGEGGLLDDVTDGELIGLAVVANRKLAGSERTAVLARCRAIGAIS